MDRQAHTSCSSIPFSGKGRLGHVHNTLCYGIGRPGVLGPQQQAGEESFLRIPDPFAMSLKIQPLTVPQFSSLKQTKCPLSRTTIRSTGVMLLAQSRNSADYPCQ